jgi:hypothetical protein
VHGALEEGRRGRTSSLSPTAIERRSFAASSLVPAAVLTEGAFNERVFFDNYIDRVALACVNQLTPKWSTTLAAYDVYIWGQCFAMEQSLRID